MHLREGSPSSCSNFSSERKRSASHWARALAPPSVGAPTPKGASSWGDAPQPQRSPLGLVPHQGPPLVTPQDREFSSLPTRGPAAYSGSPVSLTPGCQEMRHVLIPPYVLPEPTVMGSTFPSNRVKSIFQPVDLCLLSPAVSAIFLSVEDDNDNAPQFSEKRYVVQVREDVAPGAPVLRVTASDRDKGSNALVHYSIMSGNARGQFYLDAQTGALDVVSPLDYETTKEYTLRVRAQDGGRPPLSNARVA